MKITIVLPKQPGIYDISEILLRVKPGVASIKFDESSFEDGKLTGRKKYWLMGILLSMDFGHLPETKYYNGGSGKNFDEAIEEAIDNQIEAEMQQAVNDRLSKRVEPED